ncbi:hypothetical protein, partial [Bradyrhizobium ottawaense]|uniref:hypothetical protein n=1 Tax=Bradyrhizobium ottawaense TaxID=931866 RepID=UPI0030C663C1
RLMAEFKPDIVFHAALSFRCDQGSWHYCPLTCCLVCAQSSLRWDDTALNSNSGTASFRIDLMVARSSHAIALPRL